MNSDMVKRIAILTMGGIAGGAIGYFLGGLIAYKVRDAELTRIEKEMLAELVEKEGYDGQQLAELEEKKAPVKKKKVSKEKENGSDRMKKIDYQDYFKKAPLSDLAEPYKSSLTELEHIPDINDVAEVEPDIFIISLEEYNDEHIEHDKAQLSYYEDDDTLCSLDEKMIDAIDKLIGSDALLHFGDKSEDPDIVYVRNKKNATDYEVVRIHNSYQEIVLGVKAKPTRPVKGSSRKAKKKNAESQDE